MGYDFQSCHITLFKMYSLQQMSMGHTNKKKEPYAEKEQSIKTAPEKARILEYLGKNIKLPILNRFRN